MRAPYWFLMSACFFCACASSVKVLKPTGEIVTLTLKNASGYDAELLSISDSTIYLMHQNQIGRIALLDVKKIHVVQGYEISPAAKLIAVIPSIFIEGVIVRAAGIADERGWQLAAGVAMAGTALASLTGNPRVNFSPPLKKKEVEMLRLYCRYPQGLSRDQWETLFRTERQQLSHQHR